MIKILLLISFITYSFAKINLSSFCALFSQKIINDQNKTLRYSGEVYFLYPNKIKWIYKKPINKTIIIKNGKATIIEPELEQVIIKKLNPNQDLISILKNAKNIAPNLYVAKIDKKKFFITFDKTIKKIEYKDEMDNKVIIEFKSLKCDLKESIFNEKIPYEFDIIYE